jgi:glycosyltransferase involved in cell wall biosynthesis
MPLRILLLIGRFPPESLGGAELQAAALAQRLAARGHSVTVLTGRRSRLPSEETRDGYRLLRSATGRVPGLRFVVSAVSTAREIARLAPSSDLLLCYQTFASGYLGVRAASRHGLPCAVWVRGTGEFDPGASLQARLFARNVYGRADRIFVQSPRMREELLRHHGGLVGPAGPIEARIRIVPNGLEVSSGPGGAVPLPQGEAETVVFLGRLVSDKGVDDLIRAVSAIPGASLEILGDGPERGRLERLAAGTPARFAGRVEPRDVASRLAQAGVVVHPAHRGDGLPNVVLEAMALGRPVVATATAGIPDIVRDGVDGLLVPAGDVDALRAAIEGLLRDPALRIRLGESAALRAREFAWEAILPRVEEALRDAVVSFNPASK